jgi:hypothetical protein
VLKFNMLSWMGSRRIVECVPSISGLSTLLSRNAPIHGFGKFQKGSQQVSALRSVQARAPLFNQALLEAEAGNIRDRNHYMQSQTRSFHSNFS